MCDFCYNSNTHSCCARFPVNSSAASQSVYFYWSRVGLFLSSSARMFFFYFFMSCTKNIKEKAQNTNKHFTTFNFNFFHRHDEELIKFVLIALLSWKKQNENRLKRWWHNLDIIFNVPSTCHMDFYNEITCYWCSSFNLYLSLSLTHNRRPDSGWKSI